MDEGSMKIVVCGDSFCAASAIPVKDIGERAHFSQILEDQYGHTTINLAHGGMSNTGIWFQIREAIKLAPDAIVYNQTWSSRIELMMNRQDFTLERGLKNFIYFDTSHTSTGTEHVGDMKTGNVLSIVWQGLKDHPMISVSDEQLRAVELYLKHMYHDGLDTEVDSWMFEYWHDKITKNNIVPIRFNDDNIGKIAYDFSEKHPIDSPFHTDRATQEIVAANIHRIING